MIYFINNSLHPAFNLALEEIMLKSEIKDRILLLWQNKHAVVIGRNQNAYEEVKLSNLKADHVDLVRRQSGGGAVYQDLGNLCFSFIVDADQNRSYQKMCEPIIKTLNRLGVPAYFEGKNDIKVNGKKISGNAQYLYKKRLLHHGTILFDVKLDKITKYLNPDQAKLQSKGIKSMRSQVINIKPLFSDPQMTIAKLKDEIKQDLLEADATVRDLPAEFMSEAKILAEQKYQSWDWTFGVFPKFTHQNKKRFPDKGTVEIMLDIERGHITSIKFYGDFRGSDGVEKAEKVLMGVKYQKGEITRVLTPDIVHSVFGQHFVPEEIVDLVLGATDS